MTNLLAALFRPQQGEALLKPGNGKGGAVPGTEGLFAALLPLMQQASARGDATAGQGGDAAERIAAILGKAESALAQPDLSDAEIETILDELTNTLAAEFPAFAGMIMQLVQPQAAQVAPDGKATPLLQPGEDVAPRRMAEAVPALRKLVEAALGQPGAAAPGPEAGTADDAKSDGALTALLADVVRAAARTAPGETFSPGMLADPAAPLPVSGPGATASASANILPPPPVHATPQARLPEGVEPRQILHQIRAEVGESGGIKVALRPDGLGHVEIDLRSDDRGELRVTVRAENAAVLTALRGERDGLVAMLREAGHSVSDRSLNFGDLGAGDPRPGDRSAGQGTPGAGPAVTGGEAEDDEQQRQPVRRVMADGRVDMSI